MPPTVREPTVPIIPAQYRPALASGSTGTGVGGERPPTPGTS
jgi:hypothetical protein